MFFYFLIPVWFFSCIVAIYAGKKGLSTTLFYLISFFFTPIVGFGIAYSSKPTTKPIAFDIRPVVGFVVFTLTTNIIALFTFMSGNYVVGGIIAPFRFRNPGTFAEFAITACLTFIAMHVIYKSKFNFILNSALWGAVIAIIVSSINIISGMVLYGLSFDLAFGTRVDRLYVTLPVTILIFIGSKLIADLTTKFVKLEK